MKPDNIEENQKYSKENSLILLIVINGNAQNNLDEPMQWPDENWIPNCTEIFFGTNIAKRDGVTLLNRESMPVNFCFWWSPVRPSWPNLFHHPIQTEPAAIHY